MSRVKTEGQITIPVSIRKLLGLKEGDKIAFLKQNGKVYIENAVKVAFREIQQAFEGEAEKNGIINEEDVNKLVKEVRRELWEDKALENQKLTQTTSEVAQNFLTSIQEIRKEFTTDDIIALDELENGKYKPIFENRSTEL